MWEAQKSLCKLSGMEGCRKDAVRGEQNGATRLSNRFGHMRIFSEKHFLELSVDMETQVVQ